jgi:4-aminobutyrate---pyruvate transaminase
MDSSQLKEAALKLVNNFSALDRITAEGVRTMVSGSGVFVRDRDGREYLDGISGLWCTSLGFSETELVEAAVEQLGRLPSYHIAIDKAADVTLELCAKLADIGPGRVARVLLTNSGSEANDTQIKLLNYFWRWRGEPGRRTFIARHGAFHGSTLAAASISDMGESAAAFGLPLLDVRRISAPCAAWHAREGEPEEEFTARLAAELEQVILQAGPDTVAGVFLEPVMGAGGVIVPPAGYYAQIQQVIERYQLRLVADEVICGFGRLGTMWGCDSFGIRPAATSCAKALSSGYSPIGAVLVDHDMEEALLEQSKRLGTFAHGFTGGGHPVSAAIALRTLQIIEERNIVPQAARLGELMQRQLRELAGMAIVADVRGVGLLAGVELAGPAARQLVTRAVQEAAARGVIVRGIGPTICLCPPLIISEDELALLTGRLKTVLAGLSADAVG